jgi:simple sugar transport system ATP-binding protein
MAPVLELKGITKRFPGVLANDHIDLTLQQGEIHATTQFIRDACTFLFF